jgi:hypothetical protein
VTTVPSSNNFNEAFDRENKWGELFISIFLFGEFKFLIYTDFLKKSIPVSFSNACNRYRK